MYSLILNQERELFQSRLLQYIGILDDIRHQTTLFKRSYDKLCWSKNKYAEKNMLQMTTAWKSLR